MRLLSFLPIALFAGVANSFGTLCGSDGVFDSKRVLETAPLPQNLKIAFLGDAGYASQQREVLTMVKNWGAAAVIHSGDFEYLDDAELFEENLNAVLGPNYPYFASIGNHDVNAWAGFNGHQARLVKRLQAFGGDKNCTGEYGINMFCNWNGLSFVLSGVGTQGSGHNAFIEESLSSTPAIWKFVSWHKNQRLMQIGGKSDETGWAVYDTTRSHGAIVVTAHEHSFCRSHLMSDFEDQVISSTNATLNVRPGESFVFVSGLGGKDIRSWDDDLAGRRWWAAVGASDNGISDGALLCSFYIDGNPRKANCKFQDRKGKIWDDFDIISSNPETKEELSSILSSLPRPCSSKFLEFPISSSSSDFQESFEGLKNPTGKIASLGSTSKTTLSFEGIPLSKGAKIQHAFLQVYGAEDQDGQKGDFVISGRGGRKMRRAKKQAVWIEDDEDWERHTVWVSPDLKEIVQEVVEGGDFDGRIELSLKGRSQKGFYTFDASPCLAPTLVIELERDC